MAKKTKFSTDDFGFDDDFDIPDFGDAMQTDRVKKDRNPAVGLGKDVLAGVKESTTNPYFVRKAVKAALPRGYGEALDLADEAHSTLKSLYNDTTKELKPVINDLKRTTKKILPNVEKVVPKGLMKKLNSWADSADKPRAGFDEDNAKETALQMDLGSIFGPALAHQIDYAAKRDADVDARDQIKMGMDQTRHKDSMGQLDAIRQSVQQLSAYQNKVTVNYQRKSLELQMRSFFLQRDAFAEQKAQGALQKEAFEKIVKNTGLPDYQKLTEAENIKQIMRNKFIDALDDGIFAKRRQFIRDFAKGVREVAMEKVKGFTDSIRDNLEQVDFALEASQQAEEMQAEFGGEKGPSMAGTIGGAIAGDIVGGKILSGIRKANKKARSWDKSGKVFGHIDRTANNLSFARRNLPEIARNYANTDDESHWAHRIPGAGFVKDVINRIPGQDVSIEKDRLKDMAGPAIFSNKVSKSITEIIPGYLARIFRELQVLRTGDEKIELTGYDYQTNRFKKATALARDTVRSLISKYGKKNTQDDAKTVLDLIDPQGNLTTEQRKALAGQLLKDNLAGNVPATKQRYTDPSHYYLHPEAGKHAGALADQFQEFFGDDHLNAKRNQFADARNKIGQSVGDARETIQHLVNVGQEEFLIDAGILSADGSIINTDKFYELHLYDEPNGKTKTTRTRRRKGLMPNRPAKSAGAGVKDLYRDMQQPSPYAETSHMAQPQWTELMKAVSDGNVKSETISMEATLKRIEEELKKGLIVYENTGEGQGEGAHPTRKRFWDRSVRDHAGSVLDAGRRGLDLLGGRAKSGYGSAKSGLGRARDFASKWSKIGYEKATERGLYFKGKLTPALSEAKLLAGKYTDQATGEVLKSWSDIKGAVMEDGRVVLKAEQIKELFEKTEFGSRAWAYGSVAWEKAKAGLEFAKRQAGIMTGMARKFVGGVYGVAFDLAKKAWDTIDGPQDIYIRDKENPKVFVKKLDAATMKAGGYARKIDSAPIRKPSDIVGEVYDYKGIPVLTDDEFKGGLFDKDGQPIKTGVARIVGFGMGMVHKGLNALKGVKKTITDFLGGKFKGLADWWKNDGLMISGSKTIVDRLTEIRDLLDTRLPGRRKKVIGDVDGDGIREGSYEDQEKKKKTFEEGGGIRNKLAGGLDAAKTKGMGIYGGLAGLLGGLLKKKKKGATDDSEEGAGKGDSVAGDVAGGVAGAAATQVGKFALKNTWRLGKWGLLRALPWLGRGALALATGATELGVGGIAAAGMGALSAVGATLGAIAGAISLPVVAGIAGAAALGYGAYKLYKYLSRTSLTPLSTLRYAQYGFAAGDTDHVNAIFGLEDKLKKLVEFSGAYPKINEKGIKMDDILPDFNVDPKDKDQVQNWMVWYTQRFKPVFLVHMQALHRVDEKAELDNSIEKLQPEQKQKYLEVAKYLEGPYQVTTSPFVGDHGLVTTAVEVKKIADDLAASIADDIKKGSSSSAAKAAVAAGTAVEGKVAPMAAGAVAGAAVAAGTQTPPAQSPGASFKSAIAAVGVGADAGTGMSKAGAMITMAGSFDAANVAAGAKLDALTCIRYKTYGLREMSIEKVKSLMQLENVVLGDIKINAQKQVSWTGDVDKMVKLMGPSFGVNVAQGSDGYNWQAWFNMRFLPVYVNYLTALFKATGKDKPSDAMATLKPADAIDVASTISGSHSNFQGNTNSVWQFTISPWPGYSLNGDVSTISDNVAGLKDAAVKTHLAETVGLPGADKDAQSKADQNKGAGVTDSTSMLGGAMNKLFGKGSFLGDTASSIASGAKSAVNSVSKFFGGGQVFDGKPSGAAVDMSLKGTGGLAEKLPDPQGSGSWMSMKDLITGAAKMVGVDPALMGTMAAIESGFKPGAQAGTSSASGLYQFIKSTWDTMIAKFGGKYGIPPGTPPTNPKANALMGAEYVKENAGILTKALGRPLTATDIYAAHFLGPGGAIQLLKADPNASAPALMPAAANANKNIFFDGNRPRTVGEVIQYLDNLVKTKGQKFGVTTSGSQALVTDTPAGQPGTTGAPAGSPVAQGPTSGPGAVAPGAMPANVGTGAPSTPSVGTGAPMGYGGGTPSAPQTTANMPAAVGTGSGPQDTTKTAFDKNVAPTVTGVTPSPAATMGMGLAPSTATRSDMGAQQSYQRQLNPDLFGPTNDVLGKSLLVQQGILEAAQGILQAMVAKSGGAAPAAPAADAAAQAIRNAKANNSVPTALPPAQVSMKKKSWSDTTTAQ